MRIAAPSLSCGKEVAAGAHAVTTRVVLAAFRCASGAARSVPRAPLRRIGRSAYFVAAPLPMFRTTGTPGASPEAADPRRVERGSRESRGRMISSAAQPR
jgi:hypothetical protein